MSYAWDYFEADKEQDEISIIKLTIPWGFDILCECFVNLHYRNGQILVNPDGLTSSYLIDVHKDTDEYVRGFRLDVIDIIETNIKLKLWNFNEIELKLSNGRTVYRYVRCA